MKGRYIKIEDVVPALNEITSVLEADNHLSDLSHAIRAAEAHLDDARFDDDLEAIETWQDELARRRKAHADFFKNKWLPLVSQ